MSTEIRNKEGEKIDYTFHDAGSEKIVVIGHGVTGNKDRPLVLALAEGLSNAGISALRFSFSGNWPFNFLEAQTSNGRAQGCYFWKKRPPEFWKP